MNLKSAVVVNETQLPEFVHKGIDPRPGRANHLCQRFLTDLGDFGFLPDPVFSEPSEYKKNSGQSLLAGIEKLVNQVFLIADVPRQQMLYEQI